VALTKAQKYSLAATLHKRLLQVNDELRAEHNADDAQYEALISAYRSMYDEAHELAAAKYSLEEEKMQARHVKERENLFAKVYAETEVEHEYMIGLTEAKNDARKKHAEQIIDIPATITSFGLYLEFLNTPIDPTTIIDDFLKTLKP